MTTLIAFRRQHSLKERVDFHEDLKGEHQAVTCKEIGAKTTESEFDKDIPLPALETPQFTYEDEHNEEATS